MSGFFPVVVDGREFIHWMHFQLAYRRNISLLVVIVRQEVLGHVRVLQLELLELLVRQRFIVAALAQRRQQVAPRVFALINLLLLFRSLRLCRSSWRNFLLLVRHGTILEQQLNHLIFIVSFGEGCRVHASFIFMLQVDALFQ